MEITQVDITDAKFKADPFPFYARLRAEALLSYWPIGAILTVGVG